MISLQRSPTSSRSLMQFDLGSCHPSRIQRSACGLLMAALVLSPITAAYAQPPAQSSSSRSGSSKSAASQTGPSHSTVDDEVKITEKAQELFQAGVDFIQDPDGARYGEAYRSFKAAYEESPSWKILGNLGISAMKIERDGEAIEALETYLKEGRAEFDKDEIEQVERDLRTLRASVTWVELKVNVPGVTVEDTRTPLSGAPISNRYVIEGDTLRIGVHNGNHRLVVSEAGYAPLSFTFTASGTELHHEFQLEPAAATTETPPPAEDEPATHKERPVPVVTWVTLGTTIAFTAGAVTTGLLALNKNNKFNEINDGSDEDQAESYRNSGQTLSITTDVLIGAAVVSAVIATVTYVVRPSVTVEDSAGLGNGATWRVTPTPLRGGGALLMSAAF